MKGLIMGLFEIAFLLLSKIYLHLNKTVLTPPAQDVKKTF